MSPTKSSITSKGQTTVPLEVRQMLGLKPNSKILWISLKPGEVSIVPLPENKKDSWVENFAGKYRDDSIDAVQSLLDDRKEDLILEERKYLSA